MITHDQPLVSIIIVNTHEEKFLVPLLDSIRKFEDDLSPEIIIVDNDSTGRIQLIDDLKLFDPVVITIPENVGFCKTNNAGLRAAKGKYVLLLNPDTLLHEKAISKCIEYFESHGNEKTGAIGCRLVGVDKKTQGSFFSLAASIKRTMQGNAIYIKLFGHRIKRKAEQRDYEMHRTLSEAPWLCGAFLLMQRDLVEHESFYLDEDFFLYSDDVEIGHRIRLHGFKLMYLPGVSITHFGGGNRPFLKRFEQLTISEWLCMMKIHGKFYFLINQLLLICNMILDNLLFQKNVLLKRITFHDKREKISRRKQWDLWRRFTFKILIRYQCKTSSSKFMLKFQ